MIGDIGDLLCVLLDAQRFRVIGHLCQFSLSLLKVCMILDVGLDLGVFRNALQLRRVRNCGGLCLRDVPEIEFQLFLMECVNFFQMGYCVNVM